MPKGYILSAHRSEANAAKKAAYNLLARDVLFYLGKVKSEKLPCPL